MEENRISGIVVDSAIEVHRTLGGPGLLESVYEESLAFELELRGLTVERQLPVAVRYKGRLLAGDLRLDLIVEGMVLVEVKAVKDLHPVFQSQLLTYLRLSGVKLGLLINFGERYVKDGIYRVINSL